MNTELEKELRAWLRPVSPLTAFAKSIRNEGAKEEPDPISQIFDFDITELPTDLQEKITGAKNKVKKLSDNAKTTEERRKQAEDFGRKQQSEASKAKARLAAHNIPLDGPATGATTANTPNAKIEELAAKYEKDGMQKPAALAYAKMFFDQGVEIEKSILERLGPLAGQVGNLQAETAIAQARANLPDIFKIPALAKEITEGAEFMLRNGQVPTLAHITNLAEMSFGRAMLADPTLLKEKKGQELNTKTEIPKLSQSIRTSSNTPRTDTVIDKNAPVATQTETSIIMSSINEEMRKGMPVKKGK